MSSRPNYSSGKRSGVADLATAYHEAGHAVAAWRLGVGIGRKGISVVPDNDSAGRCHFLAMKNFNPEQSSSDGVRIRAERRAIVSLAGMEAQERFDPRSVRRYHASSDYQSAVDLINYFAGSNQVLEKYMAYLVARAKELLEAPRVWNCIESLAANLIERRSLSGKEVRHALEQAFTR